MEWDEEKIALLRALWAEGHSTAEIGRRMNVSKNAVVGKAHRLNLPARPSPIRRDGVTGTPRPAAPRRVVGPTLPPLATTLRLSPEPPRVTAAPPGPSPEVAREPPQAGEPAAVARPAPVRTAVARSAHPIACCWPIGDPGTKSFRFCDAEALPGKPYCAEHAQIAYVKVRDRREEAA